MKIAILNDTHCGVRNSSDIFLNYQKRFYDEIFFPYMREHSIKNILHLGDYYEHRKFVNFKAKPIHSCIDFKPEIFIKFIFSYYVELMLVMNNQI